MCNHKQDNFISLYLCIYLITTLITKWDTVPDKKLGFHSINVSPSSVAQIMDGAAILSLAAQTPPRVVDLMGMNTVIGPDLSNTEDPNKQVREGVEGGR